MEQGLAEQFAADGVAASLVSFERAGDLRYVGQGYELRVAFPAGPIDAAALDQVLQAFHRQHEAEYGHCFRESPIEIVNVRVTGVGRMPKIARPAVRHGPSLDAARIKTGRCVFRVGGTLQPFDTAFYRRERLPLEKAVAGPAVVVQTDSTTVVPPGWQAVADGEGNLILTGGGS
jgi:N-methylhydantoinase A/oxoprolinase/acetone carboxylase beta subunit